jgi:hypothetical protein
MTTKEYLKSYRLLKVQISAAEEQLADVVKEIASLQALDYSREKIQSTPENDPIGNLVIRAIREKSVISMKILGYKTKKSIIENQLEDFRNIDARSYEILLRVYITSEGYYNTKVNYSSESAFFTDMRRAERKFGQLYGMTYQNS